MFPASSQRMCALHLNEWSLKKSTLFWNKYQKRKRVKWTCCHCRLISPSPRLSLLLPPTGLALCLNLLIADTQQPVQFIDQLPGWLARIEGLRRAQFTGELKDLSNCSLLESWEWVIPFRSLYLNFLLCLSHFCHLNVTNRGLNVTATAISGESTRKMKPRLFVARMNLETC